MKNKALWITETGVMLALLISLQWVGSLIPDAMTKQLVTGTLVNCVLAVTALVAGMSNGVTVAVISPICAFLFGIAPNFITVIPIMLGNVCYVILLRLLMGSAQTRAWEKPAALVLASTAKFTVLYLLVAQIICNSASDLLLGKKLGNIVLLAPPMLQLLPTMFSWPQLITALAGGSVALFIVPLLKRALHKV